MGLSSDSSRAKRRRCSGTDSDPEEERNDEVDTSQHARHVDGSEPVGSGVMMIMRPLTDDIKPQTPCNLKQAEDPAQLKREIVERQIAGQSPPSLPGITLSVTATVTIAFPGGHTLTGPSTPSIPGALPTIVVSTSTISISLPTLPTALPALPSLPLSNSTPSSTPEPAPLAAGASLQQTSSATSTSTTSGRTTTVTSWVSSLNGDESWTVGSSRVSTIDGSVVIFSHPPSNTATGALSGTPVSSSTGTPSPPAPPGAGVAGGGAFSPTETASNSAGKSSGNGDAPKLPPILGGVFGAVAGVGLVLWVLLFLLRHRKRQLKGYNGDNGGGINRPILRDDNGTNDRGAPPPADAPSKTQEMASVFGLGGVTSLFGKSTSKGPTREKSFVKVSGRKIPSVLGAGAGAGAAHAVEAEVSEKSAPEGGLIGADQSSPVTDDDPMAGAWSQRQNTHGSLNLHSSINENEPDFTRSSFAPSEAGEGGSRFSTPPLVARRLHGSLSGADGVGRSLHSQDGSKTSRFTEDV